MGKRVPCSTATKEGEGGGMAADRTGLCERGGGGVRKVGLLSWKGHPVDAPDTSRSRCGMDSNKKGQ